MTLRWAAVVLLTAACASLSENDDGIATLEIRVPRNLYLEQGVPLTLHAVARNASGDSVPAEIVWRSPDTTVVVDSATGTVTAVTPTGTARLQAAVRGRAVLASDFSRFVLTITERADSLLLDGPDSLTVAQDSLASEPLAVRLVRRPGDSGVSGRPIGFRIVEPEPGPDTVVVVGQSFPVDSALSSPSGGPTVPVTVRARPGRTPPDRVVVEVTAHRATGAAIPGSGLRIVVRFLHQ